MADKQPDLSIRLVLCRLERDRSDDPVVQKAIEEIRGLLYKSKSDG